MAFNLTQLLNDRTSRSAEESELVYRDVFSLAPSKENFYDTQKLESLKQSIAAFGLLQPLLIKRENGEDIVVAGHRRRLCCMALTNEGHEEFREVFCVYKKKSDLEQEEGAEGILNQIMLIQANNFRDKTDWEKMTEAVKMENLIKELRKTVDLKGKTRSNVSEITGESETQIQRYRTIYNNLHYTLMAGFKDGKINISTAYELAKLPKDSQTAAAEELKTNGMLSINFAKELKAQEEIPGQDNIMNHPEYCPDEDNAQNKAPDIIPLEIQLQNFFEGLKKMEKDIVEKRDIILLTDVLYMRYEKVSVKSRNLIFTGVPEGIVFNNDLQPEFLSWRMLAKELIERFGKRRQVKMASICEEPEGHPKEPDKEKSSNHNTDTSRQQEEQSSKAPRTENTKTSRRQEESCPDCQRYSIPARIIEPDTGEIQEIQFTYCPMCGRKIEGE